MEMMKQFKVLENRGLAKMVVYENTHFPRGFAQFLDTLVIENVLSEDTRCVYESDSYTWASSVDTGGIQLKTTIHPYMNQNKAGRLILTGPKNLLEEVHAIIERHKVFYEGAPEQTDVEVKVEYHNHLNPKLWLDGSGGEIKLQRGVQKALESIVQSFYEFLEIPNLSVQDVTITGSSANFNWTKSSDIDLHIVVDMEAVKAEFGELVVNYFDAKKKVWNELHDINIKGIPVELYIQDEAETHTSTGVYSIQDKEWVVVPKHEPPSVDDTAVKAKAAEWISIIKDLMNSNKASVIEEFMKKLRRLRQSGLDKGGEFSTNNLAFKILRNEGWLDKLVELKTKIFDRELSVEEEEWSMLE
jgi:hypothetical protein